MEEISSRSHEYEHQRLKVLLKLLDGACDVAIACVDAACQLTVPRQVLRDAVLDLAEGPEISIDRAVRALTLLGYERFDAVDGSGQFSLRGGILDFFMPDSEYRRETGLILRCDRKVGNPFQTKQGSRPSCPD